MTGATNILTEQSDPFCLSPAQAAELLAGAPWHRFAAVGDSLAAGIGDPSPGYATRGWADRLADVLRRIHPDLAYLNTGQVGATATRTLATQANRMIAFGPDLIHLSCGANDLFRPEPDFTTIERTLRRLYELAAGTGARLTTFTLGKAFVVPGLPDWPQRVTALNALTRRLARDHDVMLIDMWDHPINVRPNLLSADRIHFSASGQAVMASEVIRALATLTEPR